jgi:hypothetical protein
MVLVFDEQSNRCSKCYSVFKTGLNVDKVLFVSLSVKVGMRSLFKIFVRNTRIISTDGRGQITLSRSSSTELDLYILWC